MVDITPIINAAILLVAALITCFLIPYIKSVTTAKQQEQLQMWVQIAVDAAEQIYVGSGRGKEKKEYVLNFLEEHGYTADLDAVDALIEACVLNLNS